MPGAPARDCGLRFCRRTPDGRNGGVDADGKNFERPFQTSFPALPYISVTTDPTSGGVLASFALLGDLSVAEPGTLLAFAGSRVIEATIGHKIPKHAWRGESALEHGVLDTVVQRKDLKRYFARALRFMTSPDF